MKKLVFSLATLAVMLSSPAQAGNIVNGWSEYTKITLVRGFSTQYEVVLLPSTLAGCGTANNNSWLVVLDTGEGSKLKRSMLMLAWSLGKNVALRCENSLVTDYIVQD